MTFDLSKLSNDQLNAMQSAIQSGDVSKLDNDTLDALQQSIQQGQPESATHSLLDKALNFGNEAIVQPTKTLLGAVSDYMVNPAQALTNASEGLIQEETAKMPTLPKVSDGVFTGNGVQEKDTQNPFSALSKIQYQAPHPDAPETRLGAALPSIVAATAAGGPAEALTKSALEAALANVGKTGAEALLKKAAIGSASLGAGGAAAGIATGQPIGRSALLNTVGFAPFAALRVAGHSIPTAIDALSNTRSHIGNYILKKAREGGNNPKDVTFSPEKAADTVATNYTNPDGSRMTGIDFGTVINHPMTKDAFDTLKRVPFSGAFQHSQEYGAQAAQKAISDAQGDLEDFKNLHKAGINTAAQKAADAFAKMGATKSQIDEVKANMPQDPRLASRLNMLLTPENAKDIDAALHNGVYHTFKNIKDISDKLYGPINSANNIRVDGLRFDSSRPLIHEYLANKENLDNLAQSPIAQQSGVSSAINNVNNMMSRAEQHGLTYGEIRGGIQDLQHLARKAPAMDRRVNASRLNNLAGALKSDMLNHMRSTGQSDLADSLGHADSFFKENVLPFREDNAIDFATSHPITDSVLQSTNPDLARRLLHSMNREVLSKLDPDTRNAAFFHAITKTKSPGGETYLTSDNNQLKSNFKQGVNGLESVIKRYNPKFYSVYKSALDDLDRYNNAHKELEQLHKQFSQDESLHGKLYDSYNDKLDKFNNGVRKREAAIENLKETEPRKYNKVSEAQKTWGNKLAGMVAAAVGATGIFHPAALSSGLHIAVPAAAATVGAARYISKLLTDPELLDHYLKNTNFKVNKKMPVPSDALKAVEKLLRYSNTGQALSGVNKNG